MNISGDAKVVVPEGVTLTVNETQYTNVTLTAADVIENRAELTSDDVVTDNPTEVVSGDDTQTLKATISPASKTVKYAKVKKASQKVTIKVGGSEGKVTAKNTSGKKIKKYLGVKVNGSKVVATLKKGAKKGVYKIKVVVAASGNYLKTTMTVKIKVK